MSGGRARCPVLGGGRPDWVGLLSSTLMRGLGWAVAGAGGAEGSFLQGVTLNKVSLPNPGGCCMGGGVEGYTPYLEPI